MRYQEVEKYFQDMQNFLYKIIGLSPVKEKNSEEKKKEYEKRANFEKLKYEDKLSLIKPQLDFLTSAVQRKTEILPTIATLAAGLIVITTFNSTLVPLSEYDTKCILSLLLFLIPYSLYYYVKQMEKTAATAIEILASYQGDDHLKDINVSFTDQLDADFPILMVYLLYGIVFFILIRMWV